MTTFDGRMFLQPGACQYVLAKSRGSSRFTVTLQYTTCAKVASHTVSCTHTLCRTDVLYPQSVELFKIFKIDLVVIALSFAAGYLFLCNNKKN